MSDVRFIDRSEAFAASPAIAAVTASLQSLWNLEDHLVEEGESVFLDGESTVLTAQQAEEWNAEAREHFARCLDPFLKTPDPAVREREIIAEPDCRSMRGIGGAMKRHMIPLAAEFGAGELIVLPAVRASILSQSNDYPPVARATAALEAAGFAQPEGKAGIGPTEVVAELFGPLFWIAVCNASAPDIVVGAPGMPLAAWFCKYGNLHFTATEDHGEMIEALERSGFRLPPDGMCDFRFSRYSGWAGRRIEI